MCFSWWTFTEFLLDSCRWSGRRRLHVADLSTQSRLMEELSWNRTCHPGNAGHPTTGWTEAPRTLQMLSEYQPPWLIAADKDVCFTSFMLIWTKTKWQKEKETSFFPLPPVFQCSHVCLYVEWRADKAIPEQWPFTASGLLRVCRITLMNLDFEVAFHL